MVDRAGCQRCPAAWRGWKGIRIGFPAMRCAAGSAGGVAKQARPDRRSDAWQQAGEIVCCGAGCDRPDQESCCATASGPPPITRGRCEVPISLKAWRDRGGTRRLSTETRRERQGAVETE